MKTPKKAFTVELDGIVLKQIDQRSMVTGRSRSQEVCYLASRAMAMQPSDEDLLVGIVEVPKRTSIYLDEDLRSMLEGRAAQMHTSTGKLLNTMLKFFLDYQAGEDEQVIDALQRKDQLQHSPLQTEADGSPLV